MWKSTLSSLALLLFFSAANATPLKLGEPRVNLNDTVIISCPTDGTFLWLLPDMTGVDESTNEEPPYRFQVHFANNTLTISGVELEDDGIYTCVVRRPSNKIDSFFVRLRVIPGLYEGNAWAHYEDNFILGFVAAGTICVIVTFLYLIAKFRWRPRPAKDEPRDLYPTEVPSASEKL